MTHVTLSRRSILTGVLAAATVCTTFALVGGGEAIAPNTLAHAPLTLAPPHVPRIIINNPTIIATLPTRHQLTFATFDTPHATAVDAATHAKAQQPQGWPSPGVDANTAAHGETSKRRHVETSKRRNVETSKDITSTSSSSSSSTTTTSTTTNSGTTTTNSGGGGVSGGGGGGCPGTGSCFEPNTTPGCDNETCCNAVCAFEPSCCIFEWDATCVALAQFTAECEPDCAPFASQNAIYSNWHPKCQSGDFGTHGSNLLADDLWWGDSSGTLEALTFSIVNNAASTLEAVTLEVILSRTAPGTQTGTLDLSSALVILSITLDAADLAAGEAALVSVDELSAESIQLPAGGVYAGLRFIAASFTSGGELSDLGQLAADPPGLGDSADVFFLEGSSAWAWFGGDPAANLAWELVTKKEPASGEDRLLYHTGRQQEVIWHPTGSGLTNLGWSSGNITPDLPQRWLAQPFTLEVLPDGNKAWRINGLFVHGFDPGGVFNETLEWIIWSRDGEEAPVDGDQIASGSIPFPLIHFSYPGNAYPTHIHAIYEGVDVELEPGDYYLTVYGANTTGALSNFAWFTNAANGIDFVDPIGPWNWRSAMFPSPGFVVNQIGPDLLEPNPDQADPNTTHTSMFFITGEIADPTPTPCPGDLTGSGSVGVGDLLALLGCWGPVAPGCEAADLSDSGTVGVADLLILLGNWGPCR